ncbi:MAG: LPS export ABC transporter periplasmic protein LptC, partial [Pseudomonadota bacterium]
FNATSSEIERFEGDQVVTMVNARFTGRNVAGEAFEITADTARRRRTDPSVIDLENPRLVDQLGTVVTAPTGTYHQNDEYLDLFEDVRVIDSEGYAFNTTAARAFVQDGRVQGLEPLQGTGPLGDVRADTYEILDEGDRVVLRGNVDMTIYPGGRDGAPSQDPME